MYVQDSFISQFGFYICTVRSSLVSKGEDLSAPEATLTGVTERAVTMPKHVSNIKAVLLLTLADSLDSWEQLMADDASEARELFKALERTMP